jgi:ribulose-5-phosphate 4-epimerase/fuculose-1-phosphate aldolase
MADDDVRHTVAATARMLARAGLVEAFGHVSARVDHRARASASEPVGGDLRVAITSVRPLGSAVAGDVVVCDRDGVPRAGPGDELPLETALHLAIYRARPDVWAICRGHPPSVVVWGTGTAELPLRHGLGALAGQTVGVHPDIDLVTDHEQGTAVARTLGDGHAVLLRANGALAVGADLPEAATRLYFLEERARVALAARDVEPVDATRWRQRARHSPAELRRAVRWFVGAFGDLETI